MTEAQHAPRQLKYFWWIAVILALCWAAFAVFSTAKSLTHLDRLPQDFRGEAREMDIRLAIFKIILWSGCLLFFAWLAVFRRKGWARYLFVGVVLLAFSLPTLVALSYHIFSMRRDLPMPGLWDYVTLALFIVAISFAFSAPVRQWYRFNSKH